MKEFKGTPGPWVNVGGWVDSKGKHSKIICAISSVSMQSEDIQESNANLIAAAPELLEVLTYGQTLNLPDMLDWVADRLVNVHGENGNLDFILSLRERARISRAAIAKALGETK